MDSELERARPWKRVLLVTVGLMSIGLGAIFAFDDTTPAQRACSWALTVFLLLSGLWLVSVGCFGGKRAVDNRVKDLKDGL
jgi:hypothetical protein